MSADDKIIALFQQTKSYKPSKALDEKILLAAKHKIAKPKPNHKRLIWSLSSVAVVVLSVNIALKLVFESVQSPLNGQQPSIKLHPTAIQNDAVTNEAIKAETFMQADVLRKSAPAKPKQVTKKLLAKKEQKIYSETRLSNADSVPDSMSDSVAMPALSKAMKPLETKPLDIPIFNFDLAQLKQRFSQLNINQTSPDMINIYNKERLILTLNREDNSDVLITAFQQNHELNLNINWSIKPTQLQQCVMLEKELQCQLNKKQTAYFKNNKLYKVTWVNQLEYIKIH